MMCNVVSILDGNMFTDYRAPISDDLLDQLESDLDVLNRMNIEAEIFLRIIAETISDVALQHRIYEFLASRHKYND